MGARAPWCPDLQKRSIAPEPCANSLDRWRVSQESASGVLLNDSQSGGSLRVTSVPQCTTQYTFRAYLGLMTYSHLQVCNSALGKN
jgi:hypothetical protein